MFQGVVKYLEDYRKHRVLALSNLERGRWFSYGADSMKDLVDSTFESEGENAKLAALMKSKTPVPFPRLQSARIKIAFIAGFRHDMRVQFAVGEDNEEKTAIDLMRHSAGAQAYNINRLNAVAKHLEAKDQA